MTTNSEDERQKITRSVAGTLVSGSGVRVLSFVGQLLVSFFLTPFVIHSLGDRMYGFWTLVGTFIGYYGLLDLGLSSAVTRHVAGAIGAGEKDECNRILSTSLSLYSALGIVVLVLTFALAGLAHVIFRNPGDATLFWQVVLILGVNVAISFPLRVFNGILAAQLRFDQISGIEIMSLLLRTVLTVLALTSGYRLLGLAWVTFLSGVPGQILWIYFSKKNLPSLRFRRDYVSREKTKSLFSYSIFVFISQIANLLRFELDYLVITAFVGLSAVTHFKIGSFMASQFIAVVVACMGVLHPVFSQMDGAKDKGRIKNTFLLSTRISICIASFIGFGLIAWGKPFIECWMGSEYLDAYPVLLILVLGCFSELWQLPSIALLFGTSRHRFYAFMNLIEGFCNLVLSLLLVRQFGLVGVALGTAIPMTVIRLFIQPVYVCHVLSIRYLEYMRIVGKTLSMVALSLVLPLLISVRWRMPEYSGLFLIGLSSVCLYLLAILFLEFRWIGNMIRPALQKSCKVFRFVINGKKLRFPSAR